MKINITERPWFIPEFPEETLMSWKYDVVCDKCNKNFITNHHSNRYPNTGEKDYCWHCLHPNSPFVLEFPKE